MNAAPPSAVFRADAGAARGGGHVVRTLALAQALGGQGWHCTFVTRPASLEAVPALAAAGLRVVTLPAAAGAGDLGAAVGAETDWLIVDHYDLDAAFHRACRRFARRICVIDDLADRQYDCDVLLDATPGRNAADYRGKVPEDCRVLAGPAYALLRPQFARARETRSRPDARGACRRLFVGFGMTDPHGCTLLALEGIRRSGLDVAVDIALGRAAPCRDAVLERAGALPFPVKILDGDATMARSMAAADIAIGAAGGMALERCCLGLPSLVITVADNQAAIAAALEQAGAILFLGPVQDVDPDGLALALRGLCGDGGRRNAMAAQAAATCDGLGVQRAVQELSL